MWSCRATHGPPRWAQTLPRWVLLLGLILASCSDSGRSTERGGADPCACLCDTYPQLAVQKPTAEATRLFERAANSKSRERSDHLQSFDALSAAVRAGVIRQVLRGRLESLRNDPSDVHTDRERVGLAILVARMHDEIAVACCPLLEALHEAAPLRLQVDIAGCLLYLYRAPGCVEQRGRMWTTFARALRDARPGERASTLDDFQALGSMANAAAVHTAVAVVSEGGANPAEIVAAGRFLGAAAEAQPVVYAAIAPLAYDDLLMWGFLKGIALARVRLTDEQVQRLQIWTAGRREELRRAFLSALSRQSASPERHAALEGLLADSSSEIRDAASRVRQTWKHGAGDFDPFSDDGPPK